MHGGLQKIPACVVLDRVPSAFLQNGRSGWAAMIATLLVDNCLRVQGHLLQLAPAVGASSLAEYCCRRLSEGLTKAWLALSRVDRHNSPQLPTGAQPSNKQRTMLQIYNALVWEGSDVHESDEIPH